MFVPGVRAARPHILVCYLRVVSTCHSGSLAVRWLPLPLQVRKANGVYLLGQLLLQDRSHAALALERHPQEPLHGLRSDTDTMAAVGTASLSGTDASSRCFQGADSAEEPSGTTEGGDLEFFSDETTLVAHVFRTLRFVFSTERNRKFFRKLFSPDVFASFIDIGHFVRELEPWDSLPYLMPRCCTPDDGMAYVINILHAAFCLRYMPGALTMHTSRHPL